MATRSCRIGIHGRTTAFEPADFQLVQSAQLETILLRGDSDPDIFERLKKENPQLEITTQLYDQSLFNSATTPSDSAFIHQSLIQLDNLIPYSQRFVVLDQPNHASRRFGWGAAHNDATAFNSWFLTVYEQLKAAHPNAEFGFPGLAMPSYLHNDHWWLKACAEAIEQADFLGLHCTWQTPSRGSYFHLDESFGQSYRAYHRQFPHKIIEVVFCANTNIENNIPISQQMVALEYQEWLEEAFRYPYLRAVHFYTMSSAQPGNDHFFAWRSEDGDFKPYVDLLAQLNRPPLSKATGGFFEPNPRLLPKQTRPAPEPRSMPEPPKLKPQSQTQQQAPAPHSQTQATAVRQNTPRQAESAAQTQQNEAAARPAGSRIPAPDLINTADILPRHPERRYPTRLLTDIRSLIIHHTAVPSNLPTVKLAEYYVNQRHWPAIGYHFIVHSEGLIEQCNPLSHISFHCGEQNEIGIGVALAGNFINGNLPSEAQLEAAGHLIAWLLDMLALDEGVIFGHQELAHTVSPGDEWAEGATWRNDLFTLLDAWQVE